MSENSVSPSQRPTQGIQDDEIDLLALIGSLLERKFTIIGITALFCILGVAYALIATPIYRADAIVQVEEKKEAKAQNEETMASLDPMNSSISDILKDRADERRRKLKNFNYKFQNNRNSIDEIEKQPAYKRQGVDLNDVPREQKVSRTSLGEDSNDDLQLRSNNSFLHDNVD